MNWLTHLSFAWRSTLRWSLPALKRVVTRDELFRSLGVDARRRFLELEALRPEGFGAWRCSLLEWQESLYAFDVVSRWVSDSELPAGRGLDVGAKNGAMLPGLATACPRPWEAVELDAHRRYVWGSTRRVYGESLARAFAGSRFIAGNVLDLEGPWAVVTWFLPFLSEAPLDAWGLPRRFLEPQRLLRHVTERLLPGGVLLVVNQGAHEASLQQQLFETERLDVQSLGRVDSVLSPYRRERFGFRWVRR